MLKYSGNEARTPQSPTGDAFRAAPPSATSSSAGGSVVSGGGSDEDSDRDRGVVPLPASGGKASP